ncbi:hypothetical protein A616_28715 [Brevibacillus brevis X23]|nr:hypothetical protein A616_28715 [Brevibacillus brevis X23]
MINNTNQQSCKGAALLMENLFATGTYQKNKLLDSRIKQIKDIIKSRMKWDEKRREFTRHGVVAKFHADNQYETDYVGLNSYLHSLGLLVPLARINYKELKNENEDVFKKIAEFQLPLEQYVKMNPNKQGKVNTLDIDLSHQADNDLILMWKQIKKAMEETQIIIDKVRENMLKCQLLQSERKLACFYGSVSLLTKDPSFDVVSIFKTLGSEFLIHYSKPDLQKIIGEYIPNGWLTINEVNQYRDLKSNGTKFYLMDLETEIKQNNMLWGMKMRAAQKYRSKKALELEFENLL